MSEQQISLYLDLLQGHKPGVSSVARASIAFEDAIREISSSIDPFADLRLEYYSATEGSLSVNSVLRAAKNRLDRKALTAIALTVAGWLASDVRSYITEQVIEASIPPEARAELTQDDIARIGEEVARRIKQDTGGEPVRRLFRELEDEPVVTGVGVSHLHGYRPLSLVPRDQFAQRAEVPTTLESDQSERVRNEVSEVVLVSPVLIEANRRWKFRSEIGEFGAPIRDREFLDRVLSGKVSVPMASGIRMRVEMEVREEKIGEVWQPRERVIIRVLGISPAPYQPILDLPPPKDDR